MIKKKQKHGIINILINTKSMKKFINFILKITFNSSIVMFIIAIILLILWHLDPYYQYEKAWKNKNRSFFIEKLRDISKENDTTKILNTLSYITDVSNCYIIEFGEEDYEKKHIKSLEHYKLNVMYALSTLITSSNFFNEKKIIHISECRKYDTLLTLPEKIKIIKKIQKFR